MNIIKFDKNIILLFAIFSLISCTTFNQESNTVSKTITIDGNLEDWDVPLTYYSREGVRAGFKNDAEYIYIALIINDQNTIKQIKMSGLEIWLDDKGNSDKKIGIKYPIGIVKTMYGYNPSKTGMTDSKNNGMRTGAAQIEFDYNDRLEELRLIRESDSDGEIINLNKTDRISLAIKYENYSLKYEIKIPFKNPDNLFGFNIDFTKDLSVGLITEKPEIKSSKRPSGMKMLGDPENTGAMGEPPPNSEDYSTAKSLDLWINVKLLNLSK